MTVHSEEDLVDSGRGVSLLEAPDRDHPET